MHPPTIATPSSLECSCKSATAATAAPATTAATPATHGSSSMRAVWPGTHEHGVDSRSETSWLWLLCGCHADLRDSRS